MSQTCPKTAVEVTIGKHCSLRHIEPQIWCVDRQSKGFDDSTARCSSWSEKGIQGGDTGRKRAEYLIFCGCLLTCKCDLKALIKCLFQNLTIINFFFMDIFLYL